MIVTILIAIAALICGGVLGFIAWQITVGKRMASAKGKAEKIVEDAKVEEKEILLKAKVYLY